MTLSLLLACCLSVPATALRADPGPSRFRVQAAEAPPLAESVRFSVRALPAADPLIPRFHLTGAKSAAAGSTCEQVDALFMDGFED